MQRLTDWILSFGAASAPGFLGHVALWVDRYLEGWFSDFLPSGTGRNNTPLPEAAVTRVEQQEPSDSTLYPQVLTTTLPHNMPPYKDIIASNALLDESNVPTVSVFAGGTSGIGHLMLRALVGTGLSVKIYLIGRKSSQERGARLIKECREVNPKAEIVWLEGEISLMAETKRICEIIKGREVQIDLLFLTAGFSPMGGPRKVTDEAFEVAQALEYYSRMLFIMQLLPLIEKAKSPRVVSVLGGGLEKANMETDDIELKKPGNFSFLKAQPHYVTLNTVTLDKLATDHPHVTFLHTWPGMVDTGNVWRGVGDPNSIKGWVIWLTLVPLIWLVKQSDEYAAQRNLFMGTSAAFGGQGTPWKGKPGITTRQEQKGGLFIVNWKGDCTPNTKNIDSLRENAQPKVWAHVQDVLRPYL